MNTDTLLISLADTHCGSNTGLMPDGNFQKIDGGTERPTFTQTKLWQQWVECWDNIAVLRKRKRLIVVVNGDSTDGVHHDMIQIISTNAGDHKNIHIDCMDYALQKAKFNKNKGDLLYYMMGTSSHCGRSNSLTNDVAKDLDAVPVPESKDENGEYRRFYWQHLPLKINGKVHDFAHEGVPAGRRAWTKENSLRSWIKSNMMENIGRLNGKDMPRVYWRAHRHVHVPSGLVELYGHESEGIILPSFQAKTQYANKKYSTDISDIGLYATEINKDGDLKHHLFIMTIAPEVMVVV